jgi:sugar phosphate permease
MAAMEALFASGRVVDIALMLMALEAAGLWAYRHARGRQFPLADLAWNLAAGACLLLALRAALTGAGWPWIALFLTAALIAHIGDFRRRLTAR